MLCGATQSRLHLKRHPPITSWAYLFRLIKSLSSSFFLLLIKLEVGSIGCIIATGAVIRVNAGSSCQLGHGIHRSRVCPETESTPVGPGRPLVCSGRPLVGPGTSLQYNNAPPQEAMHNPKLHCRVKIPGWFPLRHLVHLAMYTCSVSRPSCHWGM